MKNKQNKIIIGLTGEIGSGKTTVANYLQKRYNAQLFTFSGVLRDILKRLYLKETRSNIQKLSTILRHCFGEDVLSKVIASDVKHTHRRLIVTEAIRRPSDVIHLKQLSNLFYIIAVKTDSHIRYQRLIARSENLDDQTKTWEEFKKEAKGEPELQIKKNIKIADFTINNNGNLAELYKQIQNIINIFKL